MKQEDIRELIRGRMSEAGERIKDAKILLSSGGSGRTTVNCAYYAAFYSVLSLLQTVGKAPQKHKGAINLFDLEFVKKGELAKEMSETIHRVFKMRLVDDYQRIEPVAADEAEEALKLAESFISNVYQYLERKNWL